MATCFCTGRCRELGHCPATGGAAQPGPLGWPEAPKALTEADVRRIIREEQDRDRSITEAIERLEGLLRDRRERGATT